MAGTYVNLTGFNDEMLEPLNRSIVSCLRPISLTKPHLLSYL
jgi:hypothetical protein